MHNRTNKELIDAAKKLDHENLALDSNDTLMQKIMDLYSIYYYINKADSSPLLQEFSFDYIHKLAEIDVLITKNVASENHKHYHEITEYLTDLFLVAIEINLHKLVKDEDSKDTIRYIMLSKDKNTDNSKSLFFYLLSSKDNTSWFKYKTSGILIPQDMKPSLAERMMALMIQLKIPSVLDNILPSISSFFVNYKNRYSLTDSQYNVLKLRNHIDLMLKTKFKPVINLINSGNITFYLSAYSSGSPSNINDFASALDLVHNVKNLFDIESQIKLPTAIKNAVSYLSGYYNPHVLETLFSNPEEKDRQRLLGVETVSYNAASYAHQYDNLINTNIKKIASNINNNNNNNNSNKRRNANENDLTTDVQNKRQRVSTSASGVLPTNPNRSAIAINHMVNVANVASQRNVNSIMAVPASSKGSISVRYFWQIYSDRTKGRRNDDVYYFLCDLQNCRYREADQLWANRELNLSMGWNNYDMVGLHNFLKDLFALSIRNDMYHVVYDLVNTETIKEIDDKEVILLLNYVFLYKDPESFCQKIAELSRNGENIIVWYCSQIQAKDGILRSCNILLCSDTGDGKLSKIAGYILNKYDLVNALFEVVGNPVIRALACAKLLQVPERYCPKIYSYLSKEYTMGWIYNGIDEEIDSASFSIENKLEFKSKLAIVIFKTCNEELVKTLLSLPNFKNNFQEYLIAQTKKDRINLYNLICLTDAGQNFFASIINFLPNNAETPTNTIPNVSEIVTLTDYSAIYELKSAETKIDKNEVQETKLEEKNNEFEFPQLELDPELALLIAGSEFPDFGALNEEQNKINESKTSPLSCNRNEPLDHNIPFDTDSFINYETGSTPSILEFSCFLNETEKDNSEDSSQKPKDKTSADNTSMTKKT